jgi:hypothetical protein
MMRSVFFVLLGMSLVSNSANASSCVETVFLGGIELKMHPRLKGRSALTCQLVEQVDPKMYRLLRSETGGSDAKVVFEYEVFGGSCTLADDRWVRAYCDTRACAIFLGSSTHIRVDVSREELRLCR